MFQCCFYSSTLFLPFLDICICFSILESLVNFDFKTTLLRHRLRLHYRSIWGINIIIVTILECNISLHVFRYSLFILDNVLECSGILSFLKKDLPMHLLTFYAIVNSSTFLYFCFYVSKWNLFVFIGYVSTDPNNCINSNINHLCIHSFAFSMCITMLT